MPSLLRASTDALIYVYTLFFFVLVYPENGEAQYFADQTGVFEIVQAKDITHGKVMKQV